jgi:ribosomal protein L24
MPFVSYKTEQLITSDFVNVKRGEHKGKKGHIIKILPTSVDILLKFTDGIVINVEKKNVFLKHRMFLRTKDIRGSKEDKLRRQLETLTLSANVEERMSSLVL